MLVQTQAGRHPSIGIGGENGPIGAGAWSTFRQLRVNFNRAKYAGTPGNAKCIGNRDHEVPRLLERFAAAELILFLEVLVRAPNSALEVAWWYITKRRVRARNRLREVAIRQLDPYAAWIRVAEQPLDQRFADVVKRNGAPGAGRFSVVVHGNAADTQRLRATFSSIANQTWRPSEILILVTGEIALDPAPLLQGMSWRHVAGTLSQSRALVEAVGGAKSDFVVLVAAGTMLARSAIARLAEVIQAEPSSVLLYTDEDRVNPVGKRTNPWFKPSWNPELALAQDYFSRSFAIARNACVGIQDIAADTVAGAAHALFLQVARTVRNEIVHVPHVLFHMPVDPVKNAMQAAQVETSMRLETVKTLLEPDGAKVSPGPFGTVRVHWPMPPIAPQVTIIVPTRDKLDILRTCIESILARTTYPAYEIMIVDNGSQERETFDWLAAITADNRVSVLSYGGEFNYSAINNFAAARAKGSYLCLLNNDTEVIEESWLSEIMSQATRPGVGAVGAKLLYPDGTIQHAGVVIGLGNAAGHAHRGLGNQDSGYFAMAHCAQFMSAVTAACLVVESAKFHRVGGLDETDLKVAYNDVDLCLKLEQAGWRNVYTPHAFLIHHESKSRGDDMSADQIERYMSELTVLQQRWGTTRVIDPLHHPQLDRASETYRIRL